MAKPIQTGQGHLYENVLMLIQAIEMVAINGGTREGMLITANSSLIAMDSVLDGTTNVLDHLEEHRNPPETIDDNDRTSFNEFIDQVQEISVVPQLPDPIDREISTDFLNLFAPTDREEYDRLYEWLDECLSCNGRVRFAWQLSPYNILEPINNIANQIDAAVSQFELRIDPITPLEDICWALNNMRDFCIPDIVAVIASLRFLLKDYANNSLNIKLDWTVLLGPLLQVFVQSISALLDQIVQLVATPVECTVGALNSVNTLYRESTRLLNEIENFGQDISGTISETLSGTLPANIQADVLFREVQTGPGQQNTAPSIDRITSSQTVTGRQRNARDQEDFRRGVPVGLSLSVLPANLQEALSDPDWIRNSNQIEKVIVAVNEALRTMKDLFSNVYSTLNSLNGLTGSGLVLDLNTTGAMLFIADTIAFFGLILALTAGRERPLDWCQLLRENPEILEDALRTRMRMGSNVTVEVEDSTQNLLLRRGPEYTGKIPTCINGRSSEYQEAINRWLQDLEKKQ